MGASATKQLTSWDLEMIEISWAFIKDKQDLGLNTMIRIFNASNEIKKMFLFTSNLDSACDMFENTMIRHHAKLVIDYLDKIVILLTTSSSISGQDKEKLIDLGKRHYHFGLKKEHFKIFENCFIRSLEVSLNIEIFQVKFENPWRKLIKFIFKQYTDGMKTEEITPTFIVK